MADRAGKIGRRAGYRDHLVPGGASTAGIIPAIESAHALAGALDVGTELGPDGLILVNLSGRGDKDMSTAVRYFGQHEDAAPVEGVSK